jgi:hypothetical protein
MVAMVILLLSGTYVQAKDVSIQQTGYNNALKRMESAEVESNADAQAVADTEKLIEKKNRQLAEERKKADLSKAKFLDAKEKVEQAQVILDKAWKD